MDPSVFIKSVLEQDRAPVVLCNLLHEIVYMNPAAANRYRYAGGYQLLGKSLMSCHREKSREQIEKTLAFFSESAEHNMVFEQRNEKENKDVYIVALRDDNGKLIGYYEKHEYRTKETTAFYSEPSFDR